MKNICRVLLLTPLFWSCGFDEIEDRPKTMDKDNWKEVEVSKPTDPNDPPEPISDYVFNIHEWYSEGYSEIYSGSGSCEIRAYYGYGALSFGSAGCSSATYGGIELTSISRLGSSFVLEITLDADYAPSSYNTPIGAIELGNSSTNFLSLVFYGSDEVYVETNGSGYSYYLSREFTSSPSLRVYYDNSSLTIFELVGSSETHLGSLNTYLTNNVDHISYALNVDYPWDLEEFSIQEP